MHRYRYQNESFNPAGVVLGCGKIKGFSAAGFTLLEVLVTIIVIAILASLYLKEIRRPIEQARSTLITHQAGVFTRNVNILRSLSSGNSHNYVEHQGIKIFFNEYRWPANTVSKMSPLSNNQTAEECWQLWAGIFQNPLKAGIDFGNSSKKTHSDYRYKIYEINGNTCRYQLAGNREAAYFFDYDLRTGAVIISNIE